MRYLTRPQYRVSRSQHVAHPSNLNQELALQHVEPLVLAQMHMQRGSTLGMNHLLRDEESSLRVCRDDLVGQHTDSQGMRFAAPILGPLQDWNLGRACAIGLSASCVSRHSCGKR